MNLVLIFLLNLAMLDTLAGASELDPPLSSVLRDAPAGPDSQPVEARASGWRRGLMAASYGGLYAGATKVGSRLGLSPHFEIVRLESAYAYDLVGHVFSVQQLGELMAALHRGAGLDAARSRRYGAWLGAFGSMTYMEMINGFMPGVRFDPLDPLANAVGAWLATEGHDLARNHEGLQRLSLEFGYKSLRRLVGPPRSSGALGNWWHDYPNGRFGLGLAVGPLHAPWLRVFASYEITSFHLDSLRNRFGLGVEIPAARWVGPWLENLPLGRSVLAVYEWLDRRFLMPGMYVQLWTVDAGPFSGREPFAE
jgi:hypothetical protein